MSGAPTEAEQGMDGRDMHQDIEQIKEIIRNKAQRYHSRMGDVTFAGVDGRTVKIAPAGFCWR
jgi:hypothetical protein